MYIITDWNPFEKVPREESENISEKNVLFLRFLKSVDFHAKSLRFATRMYSIEKHPRPPACGGLREKRRGFRTINNTVLRASLMRVENMIDGMSDACYLEQYCFRHHLHSRNLAARFLRIATCHMSSQFRQTCL